MTKKQKASELSWLITMILEQTVKCYKDDGSLCEEYYNDIILPELSPKQVKLLRELID